MAGFTDRQRAQLRARGITGEEAARQLALLREPQIYLDVVRACTIGDGIETVPEDAQERLVLEHENAASQGRCLKFVPASGAASRMFRDLHTGRAVAEFLAAIERFAFVDDLRAELAFRGYDLDVLLGAGSEGEILAALLSDDGLGYAGKPKGLIPFHRAPEGPRTPFEEHLIEAAEIVRDRTGACRVHFTVSPEHLRAFRDLAAKAVPRMESRTGVRFEIAFSAQKGSTDTLAATPDGEPATTDDGDLILRPSGHGALVENLADLDGDVVFVKNIDNVQPDPLRPAAVRWKKILGGLLVEVQRSTFLHVARMTAVDAPEAAVEEAATFARWRFGLPVPAASRPRDERRRALLSLLNRPLRVCGVVRNTGEPGGGPYWVRAGDGTLWRQIVEGAHIDPEREAREGIRRGATHFNPVDLVCGLRDATGRPFPLEPFVDVGASLVADKSHGGRPVRALERPGLWNGAMSGWLTLFVEIPVTTFTPVKTVMDLLRPEHQPGEPDGQNR